MKNIINWLKRFTFSLKPTNSIHTMRVYRHNNSWVFDNPNVGLVKEPFVAGADEVFDHIAELHCGLDTPEDNLYIDIQFASIDFPGRQLWMGWESASLGGNDYRVVDCDFKYLVNHELWLCPALLKYYRRAPENVYMKVVKIGG